MIHNFILIWSRIKQGLYINPGIEQEYNGGQDAVDQDQDRKEIFILVLAKILLYKRKLSNSFIIVAE